MSVVAVHRVHRDDQKSKGRARRVLKVPHAGRVTARVVPTRRRCRNGGSTPSAAQRVNTLAQLTYTPADVRHRSRGCMGQSHSQAALGHDAGHCVSRRCMLWRIRLHLTVFAWWSAQVRWSSHSQRGHTRLRAISVHMTWDTHHQAAEQLLSGASHVRKHCTRLSCMQACRIPCQSTRALALPAPRRAYWSSLQVWRQHLQGLAGPQLFH